MARNEVIILFGIVLYVCSPPGVIEATPTGFISVLNMMKQDSEVCASGSPFRDSSFAKICDEVKYPSSNVTLDADNSMQFLCLGLYDRIVRLCLLDTIRKIGKSILPNDVARFDEEVKKSMPASQSDIVTFCSKWNNIYPPKYQKTRPYVAQLEKALNKLIPCLKLCTDGNGEIIPMCLVLKKMDQITELTGTKLSNEEETQERKIKLQTQVIESQSKQQVAETQNIKEQNTETIFKDAVHQASAENQKAINSPDKSPDVSKGLPTDSKINTELDNSQQNENQQTSYDVSSSVKKSKQLDTESKQHTEYVGSKVNTSVSAAKLSDANTENNEPEEKVKPEKEEQTEKQTVEKAPQTKSNDLNNNAKASESAVPSVDVPDVPQNQGTSGEDISDATGGVLENPKVDVISQHTQDDLEDQFADAVPMEAQEPVALDEDVNQNSLQPSEKQEYIPHMPRIPNEDDSHFFGYFTVIGVICIAGYVGYHNKQKILAMVLEGRKSRGGRSRRRPSTANYRKLDCTLEEAVTSQCNSNVTHVIY